MSDARPIAQESQPGQRGRLRRLALSVLGAATLIVLLLIVTSVSLLVVRSERASWQARQYEISGRAGDRVDAFLETAQRSLTLLAASDLHDADSVDQVVQRFLELYPALLEVAYVGADGQVLADAYRDQAVLAGQSDVSGAGWLHDLASSQAYLDRVQVTREGQPYLTLAVQAGEGRVLAARLSLEMLGQTLSDLQLGRTGAVYAVSGSGQVIAHPDPEQVLLYANEAGLPQIEALLGAPGRAWQGTYRNRQGQRVQGVSAPVARTDWIVISEVVRAEVDAAGRATLILLGGSLFISAFLLMVGVSRGLRSFVFRPLNDLSQGATLVAQGDLSHQIELHRDDEFGQLARVFNHMVGELVRTRDTMEQQIAQRTRELEQRTTYLAAAAEVARSASAILDEGLLSRRVVELVRERFGYHSVELYVLDDAREWVVLEASAVGGGHESAEPGHRIRVGEEAVGSCVADNRPHVVVDMVAESDDLSAAGSGAAVPLRSRGRVFGVLSVQSEERAAFDESTLVVLQVVADQIAVGLDNARLFTDRQASYDALSRAYGEQRREAWSDLLQARVHLGFRSDESGVTRVGDVLRSGAEQALQEDRVVQSSTALSADSARQWPLAVPIRVRGQVVGVLDTHKPGAHPWTDEEVGLLVEISERLGVALDNARLHQATQRRSIRDHQLRDISLRMQREVRLDAMLQTVVSDLAQELGASSAFVQLNTGPRTVPE